MNILQGAGGKKSGFTWTTAMDMECPASRIAQLSSGMTKLIPLQRNI